MKKKSLLTVILVIVIFLSACKNQNEKIEEKVNIEPHSGLYSQDLIHENYNEIEENDKLSIEQSEGKFYLDFSTSINGETTWGENIYFTVRTDKETELIGYAFDFGDGIKTISTSYGDVSHTYRESGIYPVSLMATNKEGETKSITKEITISELSRPIAAWRIKNKEGYHIAATDSCYTDEENLLGEEESYPVKQNEPFIIDATISVNKKGEKKVEYFYKNEGENTYSPSSNGIFEKIFTETGCHYVDLMVFDGNGGESDEIRIRFNVS